MKFSLKNICFVLIMSFVVGCSSNPASLDRKQLNQTKISEITLTAPDKLNHEPSTKGIQATSGFGFIGGVAGALIDEGINSNRIKAMQPILKALGNYNVKNSLNNKLKTMSGNSFNPNLTVINKKTAPTTMEINNLGVQANTLLAANHQIVAVKARIKLKTTETGKIYTRNFSSDSKIPLNLKANEQINVTQYLTNNPQILKNAIEAALNSVVSQIANDINIGPQPKS